MSTNFGFDVQIPQLFSLKNKLVKFYNIHYMVHVIKFLFTFISGDNTGKFS